MPEPDVAGLDRFAVGFARLLRQPGSTSRSATRSCSLKRSLPSVSTVATRCTGRDGPRSCGAPKTSTLYDRAFRAWWEHEHDLELVPQPPVTRGELAFDDADDDDAPEPRRLGRGTGAGGALQRAPRCCGTVTSPCTRPTSSPKLGG